MVYGFVAQSHGCVRVYSEVGVGTTIRIYLPRFSPDASAPAPRMTSKALARDESLVQARPGETVLLVKDSEDVRRLAATVLAGLGYRVLEASDGQSALQAVEDEGEAKIDLVFTDVVLPGGMDGLRLVEALRTRTPSLRVLFTSGYTRNALIQQARVPTTARVLDKPYTMALLATAVRAAIDGTELPDDPSTSEWHA